MIEATIASRERPDHALRSCAGILSLARHHGPERLEAACERARDVGTPSYTSLQAILQRGLEAVPAPSANTSASPVNDNHANVRGASYYQ